jgi:hypothetical protein
MKKTRRRKIAIWSGIVILAILLIGASTGYYLTRKYPKEWNYWKDLPRSSKFLAVELELERLFHRVFPPSPVPERYDHVTADVLEKSMRLGADWLLAMQEPTGRFQYWYNTDHNQFSSKSEDNFLRQAGTSFSLTLVYEMTGDSRYLDAVRRSLDYLLSFRKLLDSDKAYFLFSGKAKLGGISLPMLTMLRVRSLTGTEEHDEILKKLANMILFLQDKYQTGQYKSTYVYKGDYEYEKSRGWESRIYPGEALFALAGMYRAFRDDRYKQSMDWALQFYSHKRQWKRHAFLSWTISAFVSLYEQSPEQKYADYVLLLSDHLLTQQNLDSDDQVYGSFHGLPSANTASYMEGLADAIYLTRLIGDQKRLSRYQECAKMGYRWLLLLQYTEAHGSQLERPEMGIGGFRPNLFDSELRIDNTQHAISAFAKGLRFVFKRKPIVFDKSINML